MRSFALATALLLALSAAPAAAEIYRCTGADGSVSYTSQPDACPGAQRHEPRGRLQTVPSSAPPGPARRSPRAAGAPRPESEAAQAAAWRAKRGAAEREHARVAHNVESFRRVVTGCNRGSDFWITDENGMKRRFTCEEARDEHQKLEGRLVELDDYLARGLSEECRRAGCLPGWIR